MSVRAARAARASNHAAATLMSAKLGLNKQLASGLVPKAAVNRVWYESSPTNKDAYHELTTQAAWAF